MERDGTLHCRWSTLRERNRGDALGFVGKKFDAPRAASSEQVRETDTPEKFSSNPRNGVSQQLGAKTVRKLIGKELPEKADIRKQSPSVIAKLMGLDTLPVQHSKFNPNSKVTVVSQEKYPKQHSHCRDYEDKDFQEFKDIYEVSEISNFNRCNCRVVQKKSTTSELVGEKLLLRKKLMKGKGISIDHSQNCVVNYLDGAEGLNSTKDRFLKILQEPDPLFMKHVHDLRYRSPPKRLSVLTSSKNLKENKSSLGSLGGKWNADGSTCKEHVSPSRKYLDLLMDENHEKCNLPTTIVVLKPNLKDAQDSAKAHPLPHSKEDYYSSYRKHRELRRSGSRDLLPKLEVRQKLPDVVGLPKQSLLSSKELVNKLITKKMRDGAKNGLASDKSSTMKSGSASRSNFLSSYKKSLADCDGSSSSSSSCSSSDSYYRKVARRISRSPSRKTIQSMQELRSASRNSLDEVRPRKDRTVDHNIFATKLRDLGSLGINSRNGWKDISLSSLSSPRSLPASSSSYRCPKSDMKGRANRYISCKKKISDASNQSWREHYKENSRPSFLKSKRPTHWDLHSTNSRQSDTSSDDLPSSFDEIRNSSPLVDPQTENKPDIKLHQNDLSKGDDTPRYAGNYEDKIDCVTDKSQFPDSASLSGHYSGESDSSATEAGESVCYVKNSVQEQATFNEAEQPSPISVLEPSFEDETSGCFDRVSADLSELRTQLQLLKMESHKYSQSSEEDIEKTGESFRRRGEIPRRAEQDLELSFVYALLNTSGIDATDQETLFATCCSMEFPIHPSVLKQLEEMHGEQFDWPTSERKLLFDRINISLAEILGERMDERPWAKATTYYLPLSLDTQGLANMVCKLLAAQGNGNRKRPEKDLVKDHRWMETTEDVDRVGKELACFLLEELVEELVYEFAE